VSNTLAIFCRKNERGGVYYSCGGGGWDKEKGKIIENSGENFLSQDLPPYLK